MSSSICCDGLYTWAGAMVEGAGCLLSKEFNLSVERLKPRQTSESLQEQPAASAMASAHWQRSGQRGGAAQAC